MIKSIKVKTCKKLDDKQIIGNIFPIVNAVRQQNKLETIALTTTTVENLLLENIDKFVEEVEIKGKTALEIQQINHQVIVTILDRESTFDLMKVLTNGDIAAKKRLLKELEEL